MSVKDVLQVGSRLFRHFGRPNGRMAIYPTKGPDGEYFLLVKHEKDLPITPVDEFEGVPVVYETY